MVLLLTALLLLPAQALRLEEGVRAASTPPDASLSRVAIGEQAAEMESTEALQAQEEAEMAEEAGEALSGCGDILQAHYDKFEPRFAKAYRDRWAAHDTASYMIMAEVRESLMLSNALAHLAHVQANKTTAKSMVTIVALDNETQELCENHTEAFDGRIDCIDLSGWIDGKFIDKDTDNHFGSGVYKFLTSMRPFLLYNAVKASRFGVVNIDADVVIRGDLLSYAQEQAALGYKMVTSDDAGSRGRTANRMNGGVVFATQSAIPILKEWSDMMVPMCAAPLGDMNAFNTMRRKHTSVLEAVKLIPDELVAPGGREYATLAGHYCGVGRTLEDKIVLMKERGEWWVKS